MKVIEKADVAQGLRRRAAAGQGDQELAPARRLERHEEVHQWPEGNPAAAHRVCPSCGGV